MEKELNIAEILKDKPKGTKLYSSACGKCELKEADDKSFKISFYSSKSGFMNGGEGTFDKNGNLYDDGECIIFPSKEMRDWSKFAWKKGDVLVSNNGSEVLFEKFNNDEYTEFTCRYAIELYDTVFSDAGVLKTQDFKALHDGDKVKDYIAVVEKLFGGKLNLKTLEIEKPQQEFKDGDILASPSSLFEGDYVFIFNGYDNHNGLGYYVAVDNDSDNLYFSCGNVWCYKGDAVRYATEEEKQRLFEALAKEGKRWNAEKKVIEDIKKEYQFKPFEKVLARDSKDSLWHIDLYEGMLGDDNEYNYSCMAADWVYCIPYEGNEQLLGTTKDVEEDYEGNQE